MEGCPLNCKIILIVWLKIAPSQWSLTTYISDSTLCVYPLPTLTLVLAIRLALASGMLANVTQG